MHARAEIPVRFMAKVYFAPSGCWEWVGSRHHEKGYGQFHMNDSQRTHRAHRVSYEMFVGPIPAELQIDHLCRNRGCVNPAHLQPVTPRENQMRGFTFSRRLAERTHCAHGHEFTPENTRYRNGYRRCMECHRIEARRRGHPDRKRSG